MRYTISLCLATLLLSGTALAGVPRVVTDIAPVHSLVAMVMGDLGQPDLLVGNGGDPHSFQLRPSQAASLQQADMIIWMGHAMTPWLKRMLDSLSANAVQIALLDAAVTVTRSYADDSADDHEAAQTTAIAEAGTQPDGTGEAPPHDGTDPHAWLDPRNATAWLALIADRLSALDPANAAIYAANATAGAAQIAALEAEIITLLAPVKTRPFVVYHDAYGYFSGHFGLTVAGELALGAATNPSAAKLADLRETLIGGSPVCIFPEANHDTKLLTQIAEGTAITVGAALDPEGAALPPGPALYPNLLRGLATTLADCLTKT